VFPTWRKVFERLRPLRKIQGSQIGPLLQSSVLAPTRCVVPEKIQVRHVARVKSVSGETANPIQSGSALGRKPGRLPHRGRPEEFPSLCVNYDTSRFRESSYFASVSSLTGARRQWRVPFEKRRSSQVAVGNARSRQALMKIVLVAAGPLFIALGLFWFGQAAGLHNAVLIDVGAGVAALGIGLGWFALR
jgi:hypothetical protein